MSTLLAPHTVKKFTFRSFHFIFSRASPCKELENRPYPLSVRKAHHFYRRSMGFYGFSCHFCCQELPIILLKFIVQYPQIHLCSSPRIKKSFRPFVYAKWTYTHIKKLFCFPHNQVSGKVTVFLQKPWLKVIQPRRTGSEFPWRTFFWLSLNSIGESLLFSRFSIDAPHCIR